MAVNVTAVLAWTDDRLLREHRSLHRTEEGGGSYISALTPVIESCQLYVCILEHQIARVCGNMANQT